jgi:hypothetical protein
MSEAHDDDDDHDRADHHREHLAGDERDHRDPERGAREASQQQEQLPRQSACRTSPCRCVVRLHYVLASSERPDEGTGERCLHS